MKKEKNPNAHFKDIIYTFTSFFDKEEQYEYSLDDWDGDKEAIYRDVVLDKFPEQDKCYKLKTHKGEIKYENIFQIERRKALYY